MTDDQGRKHDSQGKFLPEGQEESSGNGAGRGGSKGGRGKSGGGAQGGTKRIISRAIRVLDEIESRIAELRDELEEQQGGGGGRQESGRDGEEGRQGGGRGFAAMDAEERREIARKGGIAAHEQGTAHEWDEEEAQEAARSRRR